jgi:hypothetical protein
MVLGPFRVCLGPTLSVLGPLRPFLGASALLGQVKLVLGRGRRQYPFCPIGCNSLPPNLYHVLGLG